MQEGHTTTKSLCYKYLIETFHVKGSAACDKVASICECPDLLFETDYLRTHGDLCKEGCCVLGYTAHQITQPPYNFSKIGALGALYDLKKQGIAAPIYKSLKMTDLIEFTAKTVDRFNELREQGIEADLDDLMNTPEYFDIRRCLEEAECVSAE